MIRGLRALALIMAVVLALTGCAGGLPEPVRDPHPAEEPLPAVDTRALRLPTPFTGLRVVDPGWTSAPQYADGIFVGVAEQEALRRFSAVDVHGQVRWVAERPAEDTGFALTADADGRSLAVLTDAHQGSGTEPDTVTATAYVLATGEHVWGPVEVPGPQVGPGLVFARPSEDPAARVRSRTVLDSTTGRAVPSISDSSDRVVGEYHGTVLVSGDHTLTALDIADDQELWSIPLAEHGEVIAAVDSSGTAAAANGLVLLETEHSRGLLIDLRNGAILSDTARDAAADPGTGAVVILDEAGLHATRDGQQLWSFTVASDTRLAALGGALVYLRDDEAVRVHNVITGEVADAYDPTGTGTILVPAHLTAEGAALFVGKGSRHLLVTLVPEPGASG
ncbi:hypothetical protein F7P69_02715 [Cellulosimicrobium funkei]|nr:hypothetical protein [Cellulosimicrobium funkei]